MAGILNRFLWLCFLWWVLTEGYPGSWWFGLPVLTLTTFAGMKMSSGFKWHWRPLGISRFVFFFFRQSLSGGIDVAKRALTPRMPLLPALVDYPLHLPQGPARVFLANTVSLLPGTCSTALHAESLTVHVLDGSLPVYALLQEVEERVADLFGLQTNLAEDGERGSEHG
ncbi:MAG: Na+/H+ antiporter subunit E [Desulforhabdus sp.]|jgi:multicomponent Na+:H+ antiporter subunit E|nr:Na+/H+ antiporter subunit E [Desulforhabdus sp.]